MVANKRGVIFVNPCSLANANVIFISVSAESVGSEGVESHGCDIDMLCVRIDISAVSEGEDLYNFSSMYHVDE